MTTHTITISATNEKPTPLTIIDDEGHNAHTDEGDKALTTELDNRDVIVWIIDGESDITSIDAITQLKTRILNFNKIIQVFVNPPVPVDDNSGNWCAQIELESPWTELIVEYTITYTVGGKQYTQDPKLQIKKPRD